MTDVQDRYIDPNSGAAPQPGGYAGAHAFTDGHGHVPAGYQLAEDGDYIEPMPTPEPSQADDSDGDEFSTEEAVKAKELETQGMNADQGEGEGAEPFPQAEGELDEFGPKEVADAKALETQGIQVPEPENTPLDGSEGESSKDYSKLLDKTLPEVQKYLEKHPEERDAVVAAERERAAASEKDPRKGIVGDD